MSSARLKPSLFVGSLLLVSAPSFARADEPAEPLARFGDAGQVALHLNDGITASLGDLLAGPQVQLDYFIADHLSLGVMAGVNWYHQSELASNEGAGHSLVVRIGPRVGYDIPLSRYVSFWPQIGFDYRGDNESTGSSSDAQSVVSTTTSQTTSAFAFVAAAPALIHPTQGFFIGAGPAFYTEIWNSTSGNDNPKQTSLGLMATVGGAF